MLYRAADRAFTQGLCLIIISALLTAPVLNNVAIAQSTDELSDRLVIEFNAIVQLKVDGRYDDAIVKLDALLEQYPDSAPVQRRAFNELIAIYDEKGDESAAEQTARRALVRYPDMTADPDWFPSRLNERYVRLRREMFGRLSVDGTEDATVSLNAREFGVIPLRVDLLRIGSYDLLVTKPEYIAYSDSIVITPDGLLALNVPLDKDNPIPWWIKWGVPIAVVVVGTALWIIDTREGESTLPEPPDPP